MQISPGPEPRLVSLRWPNIILVAAILLTTLARISPSASPLFSSSSMAPSISAACWIWNIFPVRAYTCHDGLESWPGRSSS
ncbi:hypothetical protein F4813DRAFT_341541 [Daldinia decipiens]|uniref:uncharacterized protein n=1 Tax=Daldinia decipiens TaxID=326647 RepID=UPI0020C25694|nr:uncharacterized protein F4813DRAFT_341541 [Daldinia decipiens]KAI1662680.1 hypothetical protein F4813DRAFT_341541 [Daldinia decipiens]